MPRARNTAYAANRLGGGGGGGCISLDIRKWVASLNFLVVVIFGE